MVHEILTQHTTNWLSRTFFHTCSVRRPPCYKVLSSLQDCLQFGLKQYGQLDNFLKKGIGLTRGNPTMEYRHEMGLLSQCLLSTRLSVEHPFPIEE